MSDFTELLYFVPGILSGIVVDIKIDVLGTWRIFQDLCSLMMNVGVSKSSMVVENLLEMFTKRRSQTFCKPTDTRSVTNIVGKSISSITIWNIMNQLIKHDFG